MQVNFKGENLVYLIGRIMNICKFLESVCFNILVIRVYREIVDVGMVIFLQQVKVR